MKDGRSCSGVLAARIAGKLFITKDGLELVVPSVDSVRCSRCGTTSSIPAMPMTPIQEVMHVGPGRP